MAGDRGERENDHTPAAFTLDFPSIVNPACNQLATWTATFSVVGSTLRLCIHESFSVLSKQKPMADTQPWALDVTLA
jgi:hypothetical protein